MTSEGKKITALIYQLRAVHESVSLLLRTADDVMKEHNWEGVSGSTAISDQSRSVNNPDRWMPWEVFRFYRSSDYGSVLASISVLLDDSEGRIPEPLVVASVFEFEESEAVSRFEYWFANTFKAIPGRAANGEFIPITQSELPSDWQSNFLRIWCLAYPMVQVTDSAFLRREVVEKLVSKVELVTSESDRTE